MNHASGFLKCLALLVCGGMVALPASAQSIATKMGLFGLTARTNGQSGLVQINPTNGQATAPLFSFPVSFEPAHMAYHPPSGQFVLCTSAVDLPRLAFVDPRTHMVTEVAVTGMSGGIAEVESVTYYTPSNSLVVTCGPSGFVQNRLALVSLAGVMSVTSPTLPFFDSDYVVFNPADSSLYIVDMNDSTGVQKVTDPFGSPGFLQTAPSPLSSNLGGPTFSPDGQLFVLHDSDHSLYRLSGGSFSFVGLFNISNVVSALAYGQVSPVFQATTSSGGAMNTTLVGLIPGQTLVLQTSTNLQDWTSVETNAIADFTLPITNIINLSTPCLFLRAMVQ